MSYYHGRDGRASIRMLLFVLCFLSLAATTIQADADEHSNSNPSPRKWGKYFDRPTCKASILALQKGNANFSKNTALYFRRDPVSGRLMNDEDNMTVTKRGCDEFCGGMSWYWDALPRLMTWILPILLLLSNIELSPIDKKRFMMIFHALGDPIDSFWSLIHKIYIWNRLYAIGLSKSTGRREEEKKPFLSSVFDGMGRLGSGVLWFLTALWYRVRRVLGFEPIPINEQEEAEHEQEEDGSELTRHDCARIIATVLSGFEEISGAKIASEDYYHMITRRLGRIGEADEDPVKFEEWRKTARILSDARTNEFPRTCLAVGVYIIGIVAAFIPELGGGNTSPPGGRIASALFLSWLVPLVLVSNTIGAFTSRRTCLTIMRQFVRRTKDQPTETENEDSESSNQDTSILVENESSEIEADAGWPQRGLRRVTRRPTTEVAPDQASDNLSIHSIRAEDSEASTSEQRAYTPARIYFKDSVDIALLEIPAGRYNVKKVYSPAPFRPSQRDDTVSLINESSWDDYFESLQWLGSIYTYRPWKVLYLDIDHRTYAHRKNVAMAFFAFLPILVSTTGAFLILWYAVPEGWSCRHVWVVVIFGVWIASAIFTSVTYVWNELEPDGHKLWLLILRKDGCIALASSLLILSSTAGIFNNCYCWSAYMMRNEDAYVPLETLKDYETKARKIYSFVVGVCMALQLCFFLGFVVWWRHGVKLVRWTESRRRQEWRHEMHGGLRHTDENFLLFWYERSELTLQTNRTRRQSEGYAMTRQRTLPWR